jgi:hypothetical protein
MAAWPPSRRLGDPLKRRGDTNTKSAKLAAPFGNQDYITKKHR